MEVCDIVSNPSYELTDKPRDICKKCREEFPTTDCIHCHNFAPAFYYPDLSYEAIDLIRCYANEVTAFYQDGLCSECEHPCIDEETQKCVWEETPLERCARCYNQFSPEACRFCKTREYYLMYGNLNWCKLGMLQHYVDDVKSDFGINSVTPTLPPDPYQ